MVSELLVIGIDSLDPVILKTHKDKFPNLSKLIDSSPEIRLTSVFPVDSIPAWISIYTGLNPAKHGIVKTYDVFDKNQGDIQRIGTSGFEGRTFWDLASQAGKKVNVVYPFLAFPPWPVNGLMVSKSVSERKAQNRQPWTVEIGVQSQPPSVMEDFEVPQAITGVFGKHPGPDNLVAWANDAKQAIIDEAETGLKIYQNSSGSLFFIYFSWLDIIQHRLWRYYEAKDPTYKTDPSKNEVILDFYRLVDTIVGRFISIQPNIPVIVMSDHGHGMRPTKTVNINKVLNENNLYYVAPNNRKLVRYLMDRAKLLILDTANRFGLDYWLVNLSTKTKAISNISKDFYMSTSSAKKEDYLACLSGFAGVKSYSHGGIEIHRNRGLDDAAYEELRTRIISLLRNLRDPKKGELLFEWADRRENLYNTAGAEVYPDIVFNLKEEYGTGWNVHGSLIGKAYDHNLASGGHKRDAVFLISNVDRLVRKTDMTLMDVAPSILDILGVKTDNDFDGTSIFAPLSPTTNLG